MIPRYSVISISSEMKVGIGEAVLVGGKSGVMAILLGHHYAVRRVIFF
jgi:hypothetical protein